MYRRSVFAVLLALTVPTLVGCSLLPGVDESNNAGSSPSPTTISSPLATYPGPAVPWQVGITGTLRVVNGCVAIGDPGAVVVFPAGEASWNDGVLTWQQHTYRVGDTVSFGGGGVVSPSQVKYLPPGCVGHPTFLVGSTS